MKYEIQLKDRKVGTGHPCYIIAEIGSNHNRDFKTALKLIDAAKAAGCDAAKFQSYTAEGIYSKLTPRLSEMEGRSHQGETPFELIKRIEMPVEWHPKLKAYCDKVGITFCSTPFDESMVDVLEEVRVPFYKIGSYELTHYPLMKKIAKTKKPVILSTGNSAMGDVTLAVKTLKDNGCRQIALLHCVSQYPAVYADMNLRCIQTLQKKFRCVVGLSDHTEDHISSTIAIGLGASILEKHITLNKKTFGPDHPFALEPQQLKELVLTVRNAEKTLGDGKKRVCQSEMENHRIGRRSIIAAKDIRTGEVFTKKNLVIKRPALGLHPKYLEDILGKRASKNIEKDLWITEDYIL